MRFMQCAAKYVPTPTRGEISSYLQTLYESVAETMPDSGSESSACSGNEDVELCDCKDVQDLQERPAKQEVRKLPPGSMFEQWRQYRELGNPGGYKLFWQVWTQDWAHLKFRGKRSHGICSVCMKHKLMIRALSGDAQARLKQRHLYDLHLKGQYRDRTRYWGYRSMSRLARSLQSKILCLTIDAADQAKFAWPRSHKLNAKIYDTFQRPRSKIYGGLVHGFFTMLTVSHADTCRGSSFTAELIAHMLTVVSHHVDLRDFTIHILLDNAAGSNKNNCVMGLLGLLTFFGLAAQICVHFLRVGHTHEDGFGQLFPTRVVWGSGVGFGVLGAPMLNLQPVPRAET